MRVLRKAIVLGLAALGAWKAWELLSPKVDMARGRTAQARDRVEPAIQSAKDSVEAARDSARDAAGSIVDASKGVAAAAADAATGTRDERDDATPDDVTLAASDRPNTRPVSPPVAGA